MRYPALVVGGGPAGSAAALTLARAGVVPHLIERAAGPRDVVCGGFVGWDALAILRELGIDAFALGARPISRLRIVSGRRAVTAALPGMAAGLSRRVLDEALLDAARGAGAIVTRGRTVRAADAGNRSIRIDDGRALEADALFLATGKHELRGTARNLADYRHDLSVGLRAALPPRPSLLHDMVGVVELQLFDRGYAGLLLQEDGTTNLCLSVLGKRVAAAGGAGGFFKQMMREAPFLAERIGGELPQRFEAIGGVPYGWRARDTSPGTFRIGDQAAVIASIAGDGIAMALASGVGAARALLAGGAETSPLWQRRQKRENRTPVSVAEALRHVAAEPPFRAVMLQALQTMPQLAGIAARLTRTRLP